MEFRYVDKNLLDCFVQFEYFFFFVSCVYWDLVIKLRPFMWERITRTGIHRKGSWCMLGDFNNISHNRKNVGGPSGSEVAVIPFVNMINDCQMEEFPSHGNAFTEV